MTVETLVHGCWLCSLIGTVIMAVETLVLGVGLVLIHMLMSHKKKKQQINKKIPIVDSVVATYSILTAIIMKTSSEPIYKTATISYSFAFFPV